MMLAYHPAFMQRPPFAAVGALPHSLPSFPPSSLGLQFPFSPPTAFALHAQIPTPPAVVSSLSPREQTKSPEYSKKQKEHHPPASSKSSKSSFSIASILGKDDREKPGSNSSSDAASSNGRNPAHSESASPSTPLSAGSQPSNFYYFYPPPQAPSPFHFPTAQTCLEAELQRSSCGLSRFSAPVAVISEIVRNAGMLFHCYSGEYIHNSSVLTACVIVNVAASLPFSSLHFRSLGWRTFAGTQIKEKAQIKDSFHRKAAGRTGDKICR